MPYCSNCGQPQGESASFCSNCGRPLGGPEATLSYPQPPPTTAQGYQFQRHPDTGVPVVPWGIGHVLMGVAMILLLFVPVTRLAILLGNLAGEEDAPAVATWISIHFLGLLILVTVWLLGLRRFSAPVSALGLTGPTVPWPKAIMLAVLALAASLGATIGYSLLVDLLDLDFLLPPPIPTDIAFTGLAVVLTFEALAVFTPITEEVLFRGFVFAGLVSRLGVGWATIISAAIFSLFHISPGVLAPIFITGLLFAWLYHRTGSLWPPVLAHAGQNAIALLSTVA